MATKTTFAACVMAALSVSALPAQSPSAISGSAPAPAEAPKLPPVMHFCAAHCLTFTLEGNQLTNYTNLPGQRNEKRVFTVERFTPESAIIHRVDTGSYPGSGTYSGRMSSDGNTLSGDGWKIAWGAALNTIPGSDEERDRIAANAVHQAAPANAAGANGQVPRTPQTAPARSPISLPPGASPKFAYFPADVRAILQPEINLTAEQQQLPCQADTKAFTGDEPNWKELAYVALEIGKFAFRAADFDRGYCWVRRSADVGNFRAIVVAGVATMLGMSVEKNENVAFQAFKLVADKSQDVWAAYFLQKCYDEGIGTPVNKQMVAHLNTWLDLRPEGQALFMSIGADDANLRRQYERMWIMLEPPMSERRVCSVAPGATMQTCHTESEVDEQRRQQQLDAIDQKYNAPK